MRKSWIWFVIVALLLLVTGISAHAVIIKQVWVDIDGDGVAERLYYCVGNPGEPDTVNPVPIYGPNSFLEGRGFQVDRSFFGIFGLQEIVLHNGVRVLDTGLPVMMNDTLVIQNPLYETRETVDYGDSAVTIWTQDDVVLERTVWMNTQWLLAIYKIFAGSKASPRGTVPWVGTSALSVPWNQGRTPFQQATAYIDSVWTVEHDSLLSRFPSVGGLNGWGLQISYGFDDWLEVRSSNYLWGWDDWQRAVFGDGFLPVPDTLNLTGPHVVCGQRANVTWSFRDSASGVASEYSLRRGDSESNGLRAVPNPFLSFTTVKGHEADRFAVYDVSGRMVGTYQGRRIGEELSPGVYLMRSEEIGSKAVRIVKAR